MTGNLSREQLIFLVFLVVGDILITIMSQGRSAYEVPESASSSVEEVNNSNQAEAQTTSSNFYNGGRIQDQSQRYNARGHPINHDSRALARMSVRAHNDVLATVGACVEVGPDVKSGDESLGTLATMPKVDRERVGAVMTENELGLIISTFDTCFVFLAQWAFVGIKYKLHTFQIYSAMSFHQMLQFQRNRFGLTGTYYANVPAFLTHTALNLGGEFLLSFFEDILESRVKAKDQSRKRRKHLKMVTSAITSLSYFGLFLLLAPLRIHSILQLLSLVPPRPTFPYFLSLIPFSSTSHIQIPAFPSKLSFDSISAWALSVSTTPVAILWFSQLARTFIGSKMFDPLIRRIPKPDNPDIYSTKAAIEDGLDVTMLPGLRRPNTSRSAQPSSWDDIVKDFRNVRNWFLEIVGMATKRRLSTLERVRLEIEERITQARQRLQQERRTNPIAESPVPQLSEPTQDNTEESPSNQADGATAIDPNLTTNEAEELPATNGNTTPPSPSAPSSSSSSVEPLPIQPNSVRVSSRRAETAEIVTMELEIDGGPPSPQPPPHIAWPYAFAPPANARPPPPPPPEPPKGQLHHVSCLSNYPAEILANRLSVLSTELLLLPLQGMLVRSIAHTFLKRQGASTEGLYPIRGGYSQTGGFLKNMASCFALEVVVGMGMWEVGFLGVRALGKHVFGWGKS